MEIARFSETLASTNQFTRRFNPKVHQNVRCWFDDGLEGKIWEQRDKQMNRLYFLLRVYCTREQSVRFAYGTSLGRRKKTHRLCKPKTLSTQENETASYKAFPLGNNVYSTESTCVLVCCPSHRSNPVLLAFLRHSGSPDNSALCA
jgi:hypothetical protein